MTRGGQVIYSDWKTLSVPSSASVGEAARVLEETSVGIVLVIRDDGTLAGTVSNGDLRRGLLKSIRLEDNVDAVLQTAPVVVPEHFDYQSAVLLMQSNGIQQIPAVSKDGIVVGLYLSENLGVVKARPETMVIMAGGLGTRLRPFTEACPKPMLELDGKPMLEHIIQKAIREGFRNFIITLNYLGFMIRDYFGAGDAYGVNIVYTEEKIPLGTAGALSLIKDVPDAPLVVTNGDVITDVKYGDILDFHIQHKAEATIAVRSHELEIPYGVVKIDGMSIIGFEEKPVVRSQINAGVYVLNDECLKFLEKAKLCDMPTLLERVRGRGGNVVAYAMHESWLDVGRPTDFSVAKKKYRPEGDSND